MSPKAPQVSLGKSPPKKYLGDVPIQFASFIQPKKLLPKVPPTWRFGKGLDYPMYGNDDLPDCTIAQVGHNEILWSAAAGKPEIPTLEAVLEMYDYTGVREGLDRTQGRYMYDVGAAWAQRGFLQPGGGYERILGFAAVNPLNKDEFRAAGHIFGGLGLGLALPVSAQAEWAKQTGTWTYKRYSPDNALGGWGGHAVNVIAVNNRYVEIVTWGRAWKLTWAFVAHYADEAYIYVSPDWLDQQGKAPSGFDQQGLLDALAAL